MKLSEEIDEWMDEDQGECYSQKDNWVVFGFTKKPTTSNGY